MLRSLTLALLLASSATAEDYYRPLIIGFDVSGSKDDGDPTTTDPIDQYRTGILLTLQDETVRDAILNCNIALIGYTWAEVSLGFIATTNPDDFSAGIAHKAFDTPGLNLGGTNPASFLTDLHTNPEISDRNPIIVILYDSAGFNDSRYIRASPVRSAITKIVTEDRGSVHLIALPKNHEDEVYDTFAAHIKSVDRTATTVKVGGPDDFVRAFEEILANQCRMG